MNQARDIIYIDTDDDITVIVGKVKAAKNPAVALVPPKRVGVLQSSVNLKLVARAAHSAKKEISLITGDGALKALAALAGIPVAKTLAAEPVLAELPEDELEGDDVIRGEDLPVGEIAKSQPPQRRQVSQRAESNSNSSRGKAQPEDKELSAAVAKLDDEINSDGDTDKPSSKKAKAQKIPNFKKFRKWLLLIVPLAILVVAFLVWAIGFAPRATIAITAKTSDKTVAATVTLDPNGTTNTDTELLAATQKTSQKTATAKFDATGSKQVGDKATGTVVIYASMDAVPLTFQSGTTLMSDGGLQFTLGKTVSF
ncbi:MAG: hypothetical protein LBM73_03355 [Candidatus Nomurabacteria bacterium]|jgi:hypothetical protein|nr:hypothetical protein [Candidatus Nomurabacteria bacterium]